MAKKNCIFYLPYPLSKTGNRARQLRPRKMLMAFRELGYSIFLVQGYSSKRKKRIELLKDCIESGVAFDFMYGECSTEPLQLSDPDHLPSYPGMDFRFFRYLKEHDIPMGIFYCDVYWKFPVYRESVSFFKRQAALYYYRSELKKYAKLLDRLFIPDMMMGKYLEAPGIEAILSPLPPGGDPMGVNEVKEYKNRDFKENPLEIFYVGGIMNHYRIEKLLAAIADIPEVRFTLCTREDEWEKQKGLMEPYVTERVTIIHKNEDELAPYYQKADLGALLFEPEEYWSLAQPVKAYEYLCRALPVLATRNTAIGDFVEKTGYGWTMENEEEVIRTWIKAILQNPEWLEEKRAAAVKAIPDNLWKARAEQAALELTGSKKENDTKN